MLRTTPGEILINRALPEDLRRPGRVLDSGGIRDLFQEIADKHPEKYRDVAAKLTRIGGDVAYERGGLSFGVRHLAPAKTALIHRRAIRSRIEGILDGDGDDKEKEAGILQVLDDHRKDLEDGIFQESMDEDNPLAHQIVSGVRGNKGNLRSLRGMDLTYVDHRSRPIPIPILKSYSEGLSPAEYWAGAYGARKGVIDTKQCVSGDTEVLMADFSIKRIDQVNPGDMVFGVNVAGEMTPTQVVRRYDNGLRKCFRWTFRVSSARRFVSLVATEDHKILAEQRNGRTKNVDGRYIPGLLPLKTCPMRGKDPTKYTFVACPSRGVVSRGGKSEPLALLFGLLLGNGGCSGGWTFSTGDSSLIEEITPYLAKFHLHLSPPTTGYSWTFSSDVTHPFARGPNEKIAGTGNPHYIRLTELGIRCLAHEKHIPDEVDSWDDDSVLALLSGLFSTDGCVAPHVGGVSIKLVLTAKNAIDRAKEILERRFGIWCGKTHYIPIRPNSNMKHDQWGFSISHQESSRRFHALVPLVGVKRKQLTEALDNLTPQARNERLGFKIFAKEDLGEIPTYDLEVAHPDHMFALANGLVISNSTADSGYLGKQLIQAAHRLVTTALDSDESDETASRRGFPVETGDPDNAGSLLARDAGGYKRNTVLTARILKDLQDQGLGRILVRSPIVGGPPEGGVYSRDVGIREKGRLAPIGDYIGHAATQAISEKLLQSGLSSKHSGGVAGAASGAATTGFKAIERLINPPKVYLGAAAHSQVDGRVAGIEDAPQGGKFVTIGDERHYVPTDYEPIVKVGDEVEAGDSISEGVPNPSEIVKHKGVGEGRRYFTKAMLDTYRRSGMGVHRRNVEVLARGLIDHVTLDDEYEDGVPGDVVPYSRIEAGWKPRPDAAEMAPASAVGKYLEQPTLHHTIGTRIRPSMLKDFQEFGIDRVVAHHQPPPFSPTMVRGVSALQYDPDWTTRHLGSGITKSTLDAVRRGSVSDTTGTSFTSPLVLDPGSFGVSGKTKGWNPKEAAEAHPLDYLLDF